ncbi:MAG: CZB domain-containing protein [Pyrinomonadaceae bacterium]
MSMDFNAALKAHSDWKITLRTAMARNEQLEVQKIAVDNACMLGSWLHGEGKKTIGSSASYLKLVTAHAKFHREAARVASAINFRNYEEAEKLLDAGSEYMSASTNVGVAINAVRREVG